MLNKEKLFIFDRDDTLIDKSNHLINPGVIIRFLRVISQSSHLHWAIASRGASELEIDEAYKAISAEYLEVKKPVYVKFSESTLLNAVSSVSGYVLHDNADTLLEKWKGKELAKKLLSQQMSIADYRYGEIYESISLSPNAQWIFTFGKTQYHVSAAVLNDHLENIAIGQYKLIALFIALDQAELKVSLNEKLKNLGVVKIIAPINYRNIHASDVIFIDGRDKNCLSVSAGGFTDIVADTDVANDHIGKNVHNTYLSRLIAQLPNQDIEKYLGLKPKQTDIIFKKSSQQLTITLPCNNQEEKEVKKEQIQNYFKNEFAFNLIFDKDTLNNTNEKKLVFIFERAKPLNYGNYESLMNDLKALNLLSANQVKLLLVDVSSLQARKGVMGVEDLDRRILSFFQDGRYFRALACTNKYHYNLSKEKPFEEILHSKRCNTILFHNRNMAELNFFLEKSSYGYSRFAINLIDLSNHIKPSLIAQGLNLGDPLKMSNFVKTDYKFKIDLILNLISKPEKKIGLTHSSHLNFLFVDATDSLLLENISEQLEDIGDRNQSSNIIVCLNAEEASEKTMENLFAILKSNARVMGYFPLLTANNDIDSLYRLAAELVLGQYQSTIVDDESREKCAVM